MAKEKRSKGVFSAVSTALVSPGFTKAFVYSFGSFLVGWILLYLKTPEVAYWFGQYAWLVPLLNVIAVFLKQYFDEVRK